MSDVQPIATSTPNPSQVKSLVLQERHQNKDNRRKLAQKKITFAPQVKDDSPAKSKENVQKVKSKTPARRRTESDSKEEQRRQQALEAMQILEQRRQRMSQQNLADQLKELSIEPIKETRDELMEKKRLEAKRLKEKRIRQHLAEQEALKKKETEAARKVPPRPSDARPFYPTLNLVNMRRRPRVGFRPHFMPRLPGVEEELVYIPPQPPTQFIIRYSKDDLRSMNPYGYYFM